MRGRQKALLVLFLFSTFVFTACGGGGGGSSAPEPPSVPSDDPSDPLGPDEMTVTASLGKINNASLRVYDEHGPDGNNLLKEKELNGQDSITFEFEDRSDPMVVALAAGSNSTYYDEETRTETTLPADFRMHAIVAGPADTAISPVSELAWTLVRNQSALPLTDEKVEGANQALLDTLVGGVGMTLAEVHVLDSSTPPNGLAVNHSSVHAAMLAGLASLGEGESAPALGVLNTLKKDIKDGLIDASQDGVSLDAPYSAASFSQDLHQGLVNFTSSYGDAEFERLASNLLPFPNRGILDEAALTGAEKIKDAADLYNEKVVISAGGSQNWNDFPEGMQFQVKITNQGLITVREQDGTPISGWSVDVDDADVSITDAAHRNERSVVQIVFPSDREGVSRVIQYIFRNGDNGGFVLGEADNNGEGTFLRFARSRVARPGESALYTDLRNLSDAQRKLTLIRDDDKTSTSTQCNEYRLQINDTGIPEIKVVFQELPFRGIRRVANPFSTRYAEAGSEREVRMSSLQEDDLFGTEVSNTVLRLDSSDTINFAKLEDDSIEPELWLTNDPELVQEYCGSG